MKPKPHFVYILECNDLTLYIGKTIDIKNRINAHNGIIKGGAKYTRSKRPVTLKYFETFETNKEATQREQILKNLTRQQKLEIISSKK